MGKFDFNNSRYARFFSDRTNQNFLQTFVNTEGLFRSNYGWWRTQFIKAANETPTAPDGAATFRAKAIDRVASPMMDLRAPLGDSTPMDQQGIKWYSATIPDFIAPGIVEKAQEREYKERLFTQFGNDADLVAQWTASVQTQFDSVDASLSNMGAQLQSTGSISYNYGKGVYSPLHNSVIPVENRKKAGTAAWTNPACKILSQMSKIEQEWRDAKGFTGPMQWMLTHKMFYNVFLKNQEVVDAIKAWRTLNKEFVSEGMAITKSMFDEAIKDYPGISPIVIVEEKQRNVTWDASVMVQGWDDNIAVLRPQGFAGEIQYTGILDQTMHEKYGSSIIEKTFARLEGGIYTLVNTTLNNGAYKEWHTDVMMSAMPSLSEFPYHVIVDTSQVGE